MGAAFNLSRDLFIARTLGLYVELSETEGSLWLPEVNAADL